MRLLARGLQRGFLVLAACCGGRIGSGGDAGRQDGDAAAIPCVPPVVEASGHCARKADGSVWCWGPNESGQLGDGTTRERFSAVRVSSLGTDAVEIAASGNTGCARKRDGTLWCWGYNAGDGTGQQRSSPVQVGALGDAVAQVSVGALHACARKNDGTLWCWGSNYAGQLGDGTVEDRRSPVRVAGLGAGTSQVSVGTNHTCAVEPDGTVWCWGSNQSGEVGIPATPPYQIRLPVQVSGVGANVVEVAAGDGRACARKTDGTLWCWGSGRLGDGSDRIFGALVQVALLGSSVAEVSAGDGTCARKTDGTLWCWGWLVGDGTMTSRSVPVWVATLGASVAEVSTSGNNRCARRTDGTLWCWGLNTHGEVGDGTNGGVDCGDKDAGRPARCVTSPVKVVGLCP